jgi:broad specificity phosphatase PhoE
MDRKLNLYIVRHGETILNRYRKLQGWSDSPLTEEGKVIAMEAGKKMAHIPFHRVYTSDLGRTIETANIMLEQNHLSRNLEINKRKAFREVFFGSFEGEGISHIWSKIARENGFELENSNVKGLFQNHSTDEILQFIKKADPFHHAESGDELWERIENGLAEVVESNNQSQNENILIVTHGVVIRKILGQYSNEYHPGIAVRNSSVSTIEFTSNQFKVLSMNQ